MLSLILASLFIFAAKAQVSPENCDPAELQRSCHASVCSNRQRIPDSLEQLSETLNSRTSRIPSAAAQRIQANVAAVNALLAQASTPAPEGYYNGLADSLAANPEEAASAFPVLRETLFRISADDSIIINSLASEEEQEAIHAFKRAHDEYFEIWMLEGLLQTPESASKFKTYLQRENPSLASSLPSFAAGAEIPDDILTRYADAHQEFMADNLRQNREIYSRAYQISERFIVAKAQVRNRWNVTSCQLIDFVNEEVKANYDPQKFGEMVEKTLGLLEEKLYPKLSPETAASIKSQFTAEDFHLYEESPDFSSFSNSNTTVSENRFENISRLNDLSASSCTFGNISPDLFRDGLSEDAGGIYSINISPMSLVNNAEAVLAHEAGHFLTYLFHRNPMSDHSRAKITKLRSCLSSMHPEENRPGETGIDLPGDKYRTEEDFGDWVAATLGTDTDYIGCEVNQLLNFGAETPVDALHSTSNDNHSGELFRLLHAREVQGRNIPQSCRDLIAQTPSRDLKACKLE